MADKSAWFSQRAIRSNYATGLRSNSLKNSGITPENVHFILNRLNGIAKNVESHNTRNVVNFVYKSIEGLKLNEVLAKNIIIALTTNGAEKIDDTEASSTIMQTFEELMGTDFDIREKTKQQVEAVGQYMKDTDSGVIDRFNIVKEALFNQPWWIEKERVSRELITVENIKNKLNEEATNKKLFKLNRKRKEKFRNGKFVNSWLNFKNGKANSARKFLFKNRNEINQDIANTIVPNIVTNELYIYPEHREKLVEVLEAIQKEEEEFNEKSERESESTYDGFTIRPEPYNVLAQIVLGAINDLAMVSDDKVMDIDKKITDDFAKLEKELKGIKTADRMDTRKMRPQLPGDGASEYVSPIRREQIKKDLHTKGGINLNQQVSDFQVLKDEQGNVIPLKFQPVEFRNSVGFFPRVNGIYIINLPQYLGFDTTPTDEPTKVSMHLSFNHLTRDPMDVVG